MFSSSAPSAPVVSVDARQAGALTAVFVCAVIVVGGAIIEPSIGWILGIAGLPISVALAWRMGPEVARASRSHAVATGLWLGAKTILLSDALAVGAFAPVPMIAGITSIFADRSPLEWPIYLVAGSVILVILIAFLYLAGIAVVGIPVSLVVFPAALIWVLLLRVITRSRAVAPDRLPVT